MTTVPEQQLPTLYRGVVKSVLSGDTVIIRANSKAIPPHEKTISFSNLSSPKLGKRLPNQSPESDEPYGWEAREYLRKKCIGQQVTFIIERTIPSNENKGYGIVFLGKDIHGENLSEYVVKGGYGTVRGRDNKNITSELQNLLDLEDEAKATNKGKWNINEKCQERNIQMVSQENMQSIIDKFDGKPIKAIIEYVRDGSTVRALLLPDFYLILVSMSGIKCPHFKLDSEGKLDSANTTEFADEAKFFTEVKLLNQDVEIILESINANNFSGTIIHPKGSIAEELLKNGYAKILDWSISKFKKTDIEKLRKAESEAKEKKLRIWKNWSPTTQVSDKEFTGIVTEIVNGDALMVKLPNGVIKKIFLASIRPPKNENPGEKISSGKPRPLYDIPWMFEAREFLRKKLIGKKVNVNVNYTQPARDNMAEKCCCTVTISSVNVAEALVSKGLATVVKHRQNDDERASSYDNLIAAESKALKSLKGVHAKKDVPVHRVNDYSGEAAKAKQLFPHLNRQPRIEAIVEYVVTGSRLRLYLPKDSSLITFILSGIEVRYSEGDGVNNETAATQFTKEKCMQREVEIRVENLDRAGNFIGWLWVDNVNISVSLVEHGLAKIHFSGINSDYNKQFINAKNTAKSKGVWKYVEKEETENEENEEDKSGNIERKIDYKEVVVVCTNDISFYCQFTSMGSKIDSLQAKLAQEMVAKQPVVGAYTPRKGDLCSAKFPVSEGGDGMWYRAKVERVSGNKVTVQYIDFGNKLDIQSVDCASLPSGFIDKPMAQQYVLACVKRPNDEEYSRETDEQFRNYVEGQVFKMNVEYSNYVTLVHPKTNEDIGKLLIAEGHLLVDKRKEKRLQKLLSEYYAVQDEAKKKHLNVWEYGDVTEDDDKEFGMGR